jgi:vacuolar-type H+-ATPase subunit I/STV1
MANNTKVSLAKAAQMVGVARSTFYRHINEKGISVEDKDTSRPKIDVSELIRVYGDKVKTPEQLQMAKQKSKATNATQSDTSMEERIELETLRQKIKHVEELHATEKNRLEEQIEMLREMLSSEKEERKRATAQLTDQRSATDKDKDRFARMEKEIRALKRRGLMEVLFGNRERAA